MNGCRHQQVTRARDVTAAIVDGYLTSHELTRPYTLIEFCSAPTCEKVFRAEARAPRPAPQFEREKQPS